MKMSTYRSCVISAILGMGWLLTSCNQESSTSTPEYRTQLIDSLLNSAVQNGEIPGAVAYINRGGNEVYHKAFGYRKLEGEVHMQTEDIFRMASMTKALTAVSIAALTIYDMCKAMDKGMFFNQIGLTYKAGGKSGTFSQDIGGA